MEGRFGTAIRIRKCFFALFVADQRGRNCGMCAVGAALDHPGRCMRPLWKEFIDAFEIWDGLLVGGHWVAEMRNAVSAIAIGTDFGTTGDCGALLPSRK